MSAIEHDEDKMGALSSNVKRDVFWRRHGLNICGARTTHDLDESRPKRVDSSEELLGLLRRVCIHLFHKAVSSHERLGKVERFLRRVLIVIRELQGWKIYLTACVPQHIEVPFGQRCTMVWCDEDCEG